MPSIDIHFLFLASVMGASLAHVPNTPALLDADNNVYPQADVPSDPKVDRESCTLNTSLLSNVCADKGVASCLEYCGVAITFSSRSGRLCQCDFLCKVFGDCCHDFDATCGSLFLKGYPSTLTKQMDNIKCFRGSIPVITTCERRHVPPKSILAPYVTSKYLNLDFISEEVMECHLGIGSDSESWSQYIHVEQEKNSTEVTELVREIIRRDHKVDILNIPPSPLHKRGCSIRLVPSLACRSVNPSMCINATVAEFNEFCSTQRFNSNYDSKTTSATTTTTINNHENHPDLFATCKLVREHHSLDLMLPINVNHYRFHEVKNNETSTTIYAYNWKSSNQTHHWRSLECQLKIDSDDKVDIVYPCHIIDCLRGFFLSNGKCRIPRILTVELHLSADSVKISVFVSRIHSCIRYHELRGNLVVQSLGNRVQREGDLITYTDHYTVLDSNAIDTGKALPVTLTMFKDFSLLESEVTSGVEAVYVCFYFYDDETKEDSSRCDNIIIGMGIFPNIGLLRNNNTSTSSGNASQPRAHSNVGRNCEIDECKDANDDIESPNDIGKTIKNESDLQSVSELKKRNSANGIIHRYCIPFVILVLFVFLLL